MLIPDPKKVRVMLKVIGGEWAFGGEKRFAARLGSFLSTGDGCHFQRALRKQQRSFEWNLGLNLVWT